MGVGLYVARIVAEAHAGSLGLESDGDGKGTTVRSGCPSDQTAPLEIVAAEIKRLLVAELS